MRRGATARRRVAERAAVEKSLKYSALAAFFYAARDFYLVGGEERGGEDAFLTKANLYEMQGDLFHRLAGRGFGR